MELELLDKILPALHSNSSVLTGPGDDCAVVGFSGKKLLFSTDQVIENIHFSSDTAPERAGAKLVKRNLSDIAAMGGTPLWMMLSIANGNRSVQWVENFVAGVEKTARQYNVPVIGGDIAKLASDGFLASISITGEAQNPILRSTARPGDIIYITGLIGNSFYSEHHLDFIPHLQEGAFLANYANSMMDISDGLLLDASRMAKASIVDFVINPDAVPLRENAAIPQALCDGEDYGLLLTCSPDIDLPELYRLQRFSTPLTAIGTVRSGSGKVINFSDNKLFQLEHIGYEH